MTPAGKTGYVHGYSERESRRLLDQAASVRDLLHHDTHYGPGERVLEPGCGIAAQTLTLAERNREARFVSFDRAMGSLATAARRVRQAGPDNVRLLAADLEAPPFEDGSFDHLFVCHLLEHLPRPVAALRTLMRLVRPGGSVTVIEGDHGSCYFHPATDEAVEAWSCLVRVQAELGGDSLIGRRLHAVLREGGARAPVVTPRMVYADASRPEVMEAFVVRTIVPMVEGVEAEALSRELMTPTAWAKGIRDLLAIATADAGVFCYTFFKAVATVDGGPGGAP